MPAKTILDILESRAEHEADRLAYSFLGDRSETRGSLTYGELYRQVVAASALLRRTVRTGERALLLHPPGLDFIVAFFGCLHAGVIAVPAYPVPSIQRQERVLAVWRDSKPSAVLTTTDFEETVRVLFSDRPGSGSVMVAGLTDNPRDLSAARLDREGLAYLQYTSGSTATPKGVMVTHANVLADLHELDRAWKHTPDSAIVSWLPHFHDMGLVYGVAQPIYSGIPGHLMSPIAFVRHPHAWLRAISRYRGTHSIAPNFAYELCAKVVTSEEKERLDLRSWRVAINGSEPVRPDTCRRFVEAFEACGFRRDSLKPGYGLAEATLMITGTPLEQEAQVLSVDKAHLERNEVLVADDARTSRLVASSGELHGSAEIAVVDPVTMKQCEPDRVGEIWVRGPMVAAGYWDHPTDTTETFDAHIDGSGGGPFLRTGDLGFMLNGQLFITGRLKDVIILYGENHYPQDVETTAEESHPALRRPGFSAAFSIDPGDAERLIIVQEVSRRATSADPDEVRASIQRALYENHGARAGEVVLLTAGSLPRTSSGKIQRRLCRQMYLAGEFESVRFQRRIARSAS